MICGQDCPILYKRRCRVANEKSPDARKLLPRKWYAHFRGTIRPALPFLTA